MTQRYATIGKGHVGKSIHVDTLVCRESDHAAIQGFRFDCDALWGLRDLSVGGVGCVETY